MIRENAALTIQRILVKEIDPIMLRPIKRKFALLRNNCMINYDAFSMFEYVQTSGDLRDPVARQQFEKHEIMRLGRLAGVSCDSLERFHKQFAEEVQRRQMLSFLENEIVSELEREESDTNLLFEIIMNLQGVASRDEMRMITQSLRRHGLNVQFGPPVLPPIVVEVPRTFRNVALALRQSENAIDLTEFLNQVQPPTNDPQLLPPPLPPPLPSPLPLSVERSSGIPPTPIVQTNNSTRDERRSRLLAALTPSRSQLRRFMFPERNN